MLTFALALAAAAPPVLPMSETEAHHPALPAVLPLRERATLIDTILAERLDTILPAIMREEGIDLWIVTAREYFEDPVTASMLDANSMSARRRTVLVFHDPGEGKPIERLTVSRYGLADLYQPAWDPEAQPDQWKAVADLIAARDPAKIAINFSDLRAVADGMTLSQYRLFTAALPEHLHERIVPAERLSIRWLESRTPTELATTPASSASPTRSSAKPSRARSSPRAPPLPTTCAGGCASGSPRSASPPGSTPASASSGRARTA